jgi:sterol desaturase/sphingolipid hydroxylase (fatty acid hydroxylase superfamily)
MTNPSHLAAKIFAFFVGVLKTTFASGNSETYVPILLFQLIMLWCLRHRQRASGSDGCPTLFRKLFCRSTIVDITLLVLSSVPAIASAGYLHRSVTARIVRHAPDLHLARSVFAQFGFLRIGIGTLVVVVATDIGMYFAHVLMHRWAILWAFHSVHHEAPTMTPLTASRNHPLDTIFSAIVSSVVAGVAVGLWISLFDSSLSVAHILGANVLYVAFHVAFASARHSDIPVSFGRFESLIVSPRMHQLHHSIDPLHHNQNFGFIFSVWDRMFRTLSNADRAAPFRFGVEGRTGDSVSVAIFGPFVSVYELFSKRTKQAKSSSLV